MRKSRNVAALLVALSLVSGLKAQQSSLTVEQVDKWMGELSNWGRWAERAQRGAWNVPANAAGFHASILPWLKQRDVALLGNGPARVDVETPLNREKRQKDKSAGTRQLTA